MTSRDQGRLDPVQVAALFVQHGDDLRRFLFGVLRHEEQANDVLQTTFAKAIESGHTAEAGSLKQWLFRVAFNEAIALRRKLAVQAKAARRLSAQPPPADELPEAGLIRWERVQRLRAAIDQLPPEQRQVLTMHIYQGMSYAEVAAAMGTPLGTALSRMHAAVKKLRKLLQAAEE